VLARSVASCSTDDFDFILLPVLVVTQSKSLLAREQVIGRASITRWWSSVGYLRVEPVVTHLYSSGTRDWYLFWNISLAAAYHCNLGHFSLFENVWHGECLSFYDNIVSGKNFSFSMLQLIPWLSWLLIHCCCIPKTVVAQWRHWVQPLIFTLLSCVGLHQSLLDLIRLCLLSQVLRLACLVVEDLGLLLQFLLQKTARTFRIFHFKFKW